LTASWRGDRLVAAHNVESDGLARVRWYEISTADIPALTQFGEISQGPDVYTYYPSIEISAGGDLGMTFMQSSADEFVSMYVTGQKAGRTDGVMTTPQLVKAGEDVYRNILPWGVDQFVTFAGYWGGIAVDPVDDTFWAAHQYALPIPDPPPTVFWANWGTWIGNFSITDGELADASANDMAVTDHDELTANVLWLPQPEDNKETDETKAITLLVPAVDLLMVDLG
jgi:hypothetical protein